MLGVFSGGVSRVIYRRLYVGLCYIGQNFEEAIFLTSTSKSRIITTSNIFRQLIFRHEVSVRDPQTLVDTVGKLKISAFSMCYWFGGSH